MKETYVIIQDGVRIGTFSESELNRYNALEALKYTKRGIVIPLEDWMVREDA